MRDKISNYFGFSERKTSFRRESIGGLTTFLTMAYILFVNPAILSDSGMDQSALITATALSAFLGTMLVGLWANVPFAMAPGMGLNAMFTYTLVAKHDMAWETALGAVFLSGVFFLILTLIGFREKIVSAIPLSLRISTGAGIGLFITFVGVKNLSLVVSHPQTLVTLGEFTTPVLIGIAGFFVMAFLEGRGWKGGILCGILFSLVVGIIAGEIPLPEAIVSTPPSLRPVLFKADIAGALQWGSIGAIFSFMFVDLFDSVGTLLACSQEAGLADEKGNVENIDKMLEADAIATVAGSLIGTSTTTVFVESASGIAEGARTGFASVVTASLFVIALFFAPLIGAVPLWAVAPALIFVGVYMFRSIRFLDLSSLSDALPAFLTIAIMPLTFSISHGLSFGFISWVLIRIFMGRYSEVKPITALCAIVSLVNLIGGIH